VAKRCCSAPRSRGLYRIIAGDRRTRWARVAAGTQRFRAVDINALIRFRDRPHAPLIKAVFVLFNQSPYATSPARTGGIHALSRYRGQEISASPRRSFESGVASRWHGKNGDQDRKREAKTAPVRRREPMLSARSGDAVTGFSYLFGGPTEGSPAFRPTTSRCFATPTMGCEAYGVAVIVNPAFARRKPDAVKGFLRAVIAGQTPGGDRDQ